MHDIDKTAGVNMTFPVGEPAGSCRERNKYLYWQKAHEIWMGLADVIAVLSQKSSLWRESRKTRQR